MAMRSFLAGWKLSHPSIDSYGIDVTLFLSYSREKDPRHFPDSLRRLEKKKPGKKLAFTSQES